MTVVVGVCLADLFITDSSSLKDRRRVVRSIVEHLRRSYNVSVTELGDERLWQRTTLAVACVSNDTKSADQLLNRVIHYLDNHPQASLLDCQTEVR